MSLLYTRDTLCCSNLWSRKKLDMLGASVLVAVPDIAALRLLGELMRLNVLSRADASRTSTGRRVLERVPSLLLYHHP